MCRRRKGHKGQEAARKLFQSLKEIRGSRIPGIAKLQEGAKAWKGIKFWKESRIQEESRTQARARIREGIKLREWNRTQEWSRIQGGIKLREWNRTQEWSRIQGGIKLREWSRTQEWNRTQGIRRIQGKAGIQGRKALVKIRILIYGMGRMNQILCLLQIQQRQQMAVRQREKKVHQEREKLGLGRVRQGKSSQELLGEGQMPKASPTWKDGACRWMGWI